MQNLDGSILVAFIGVMLFLMLIEASIKKTPRAQAPALDDPAKRRVELMAAEEALRIRHAQEREALDRQIAEAEAGLPKAYTEQGPELELSANARAGLDLPPKR